MYNHLLKLTEMENSPFYFTDHLHKDGYTYRIFNYRLATWEEFELPYTKWCRGTMYRMESKPVLVSRPLEKFHNWHEGNNSDLDLNDIKEIHDKHDGSLIRTYLDYNDNICVASKGALYSDQAIAAQKLVDEWRDIDKEILKIKLLEGWTRCYEYVAPANRIVLDYQEESLIWLADIHNNSGHTTNSVITLVSDDVIKSRKFDSKKDFVESVPDMSEDIEGYVVTMNNGYKFKVKTNKYCRLHKMIDSVKNKKTLFDIVLNEEADDLISAFYQDTEIVKEIREMEDLVIPAYRNYLLKASEFHNVYGWLSQKEYAIKAKHECPKEFYYIMAIKNGKTAKFDTMKNFTKMYRQELIGE